MNIKELKKLLTEYQDDATVEFVFGGNHFSVNVGLRYHNTLELSGIPMHDMPEMNIKADDYLERRLSVSELVSRAKAGDLNPIELPDYSMSFIEGDIIASEDIDSQGYDGYDRCRMWIRDNFNAFVINEESILILTNNYQYVFVQTQQCGYPSCYCNDAEIRNVNHAVLSPMLYAMWERFKQPSVINNHVYIDDNTMIYVKK